MTERYTVPFHRRPPHPVAKVDARGLEASDELLQRRYGLGVPFAPHVEFALSFHSTTTRQTRAATTKSAIPIPRRSGGARQQSWV